MARQMVEPACARNDRLFGREPSVGGYSFRDRFARFDIGSLDIDRADPELLVSQQALEGVGPVVLDHVGMALDPADQVCLVATSVEISMSNLPIIMRPDSVVPLAYVNGDMDVLRNPTDRQIHCLDSGSDFIVVRRRQIRLIDLDVLAAR